MRQHLTLDPAELGRGLRRFIAFDQLTCVVAVGIGVVDDHDWLTRQQRVSFARVGVIEPTSLASYAD